MLRGKLDPATLPKHPPTEAEEEILQTRQIANMPVPIDADADADYDIVRREDAVQPVRHISQPISMHAYASRPLSVSGAAGAPASPNAVAAAIVGRLSPREQNSYGGNSPTGRPILRTQRTHSRDQSMFPADDDLPDQVHSHSRLNTSATLVDDHLFATPTAAEEEEEEEEEEASTHASYSLHKLRKTAPEKAKHTDQGRCHDPLETARPITITQSDVTPLLQTLPDPVRPVLVHRDSPAQASQMASLLTAGNGNGIGTGSPAASSVMFDTPTPPLQGQGEGRAREPSEMSEGTAATVRPSQEERRSAVTTELREGGVGEVAAAAAVAAPAESRQGTRNDGKVRFDGVAGGVRTKSDGDGPKRRKGLRDRFFPAMKSRKHVWLH